MTSEDDRKPDDGAEERGRDERDERDDRDRRDDDRQGGDGHDRRDDAHDDRRDGPDNGRRRGRVARWNGERGFGFITPLNGGGADVFCHITAITDGNALPEGGEVEFDVSFDDRQGKERAQNVTGGHDINRNGGFTPRDPGGLNGTGKLSGTVARWNGDRGFGFITPSTGGEDLFCHTTSIVDGAALPEGGKVTFDQEFDDKRGKEHAINVSGGCEERRREERRYDDYDRGYDRGGYDDRRGGYDDRRGGYDDRGRGGYDSYDRDRRGGSRGYDDRRY